MTVRRIHENGMPMKALNWAHITRAESGKCFDRWSAITPPINAPLAHPIVNRLFSAAELLLSKPKRIQGWSDFIWRALLSISVEMLKAFNLPMSSNHIVKKTMAVHGNEPIIPCRTMIWKVFTFITDLVATQESLQIEGGGRTSLLDKWNLEDEDIMMLCSYTFMYSAVPIPNYLFNSGF